MLENFLTILAPFDYGQIVDVNKKIIMKIFFKLLFWNTK